jgi:hypothetical protein
LGIFLNGGCKSYIQNFGREFYWPVSIVARSKASTVFGRSNIGIAGSNPARGMDVCLRFSVFVLSCVGRGLGAGLIPHPRRPTKCLKGSISKKKNPTPEKGTRKMRKKKKNSTERQPLGRPK